MQADPPVTGELDDATSAPPGRRARFGPWAAIGVAALLLLAYGFVQGLVSGIAAFGLASADITVDLDPLDLGAVVALVAAHVAVIAAGLLLAPRIASWRALGLAAARSERWRAWRACIPILAVVVGGSMVSERAADRPWVDASIDLPLGVGFVALALLVGWAEELWFRGLIVEVLGGLARAWLAIVGSALLFGLPHLRPASDGATAVAGLDANSLLNAAGVLLAVGVPFACIRLRTSALGPLAWVHGIVDVWAFLHTANIAAEGEITAGRVAAGLVLPSALAIGYLLWFWASSPADRSN